MKTKVIFVLVTLLTLSLGHAQQIILDRPLKAGDLTVFPDMNNQKEYYYISDQARLAVDDNGKPHFSFLRYVDGESASNNNGISELGGGGIVHAVVTLGVTEDQLDDARQALRRLDPEGTIIGPVIFKSGRFALVSSFTAENGELARQVVGIGKAPILDGQKAAISIFLTKLGSKLLWESFKTSTPDISFSFEMTLGGFRLPKSASIIANFEEIYKSFDLGVQAGFNLGGNDNNTQSNNRTNSQSRSNQQDRSTEEGERDQPEPEAESESEEDPPETEEDPQRDPPGEEAEPEEAETEEPEPEPQGEQEPETEEEGETDDIMGAAPPPSRGGNSGGFYIGAEIQYVFEELRKTGAIQVIQKGDDEDITNLVSTAYNKLADMMFDQVETSSSNQPNMGNMLRQLDRNRGRNQQQEKLNGIMISFKMKERRRSGEFKFDLEKWTNDEIIMRFDHPIGDLTRYENDETMFRMVNTDDPAYDQREIVSIIDGYNAEDFGEYINFVSVHMQKKHAKGHITDKEIIIDRNNFNQQGNNFSMIYGWHGDNDRTKWSEYQYEILWSFFGDVEYKEDFQTSTFNAINLAPPYQKYQVEIEADPTLLQDQEVRMVTVKLYYEVEGKEFTKQATLIPHRERLSERLEYISPANNQGYEYEITWRLKGNRVIESGRMASSDSFLFADELPE